METSYQNLVNFTIKHSFFSNQIPHGVFQIDSPVNNIVLKKASNESLAFILDSTKGTLENVDSLCFPIKVIDPKFVNYTSIEIENEKAYYLNSEMFVDGKANAQMLQHLDIRPKSFSLDFLSKDQSENLSTVKISSAAGKTKEVENLQGLLLDLSEFSDGKYNLLITFENNLTEVSYDFLLSSQFKSPFAIFEWFTKNSSEHTPQLELSFDARKTIWRYFFIGLQEGDWGAATMTSLIVDSETISFEKETDAVTLPNGVTAYVFKSSQPIPLQEQPSWKIKFSTDKISNGIDLPYANRDQVSTIDTDFVSDIYVYI